MRASSLLLCIKRFKLSNRLSIATQILSVGKLVIWLLLIISFCNWLILIVSLLPNWISKLLHTSLIKVRDCSCAWTLRFGILTTTANSSSLWFDLMHRWCFIPVSIGIIRLGFLINTTFWMSLLLLLLANLNGKFFKHDWGLVFLVPMTTAALSILMSCNLLNRLNYLWWHRQTWLLQLVWIILMLRWWYFWIQYHLSEFTGWLLNSFCRGGGGWRG